MERRAVKEEGKTSPQETEMSASFVPLDNKEENSRHLVSVPPVVTLVSSRNDVWKCVEYALKIQGHEDKKLFEDLKEFTFDQCNSWNDVFQFI
jgi:hypothetical protein